MTRIALALFVAVCLASAASAQTIAPATPTPTLDELALMDLLNVRAVTGARHDQRLVDSPRPMSIVTAEDIRRQNYRSVPQALADILGVFMQETNDGGGSPIVRGLVGNQVLILIDGVRLNTGAYRLGPNQYLNTIDINQIERIEVLRGAGSVLYGSDALGGVVNVITRSPDTDASQPVTTRWFSRLSAANSGAVGRGEISLTAGAVGVLGGVSVKQFGQLRGGRETGVQRFSGYDELDADAKVVYRPTPHQTLTLVAARVSQSGVQRTDTLTAGVDKKWMWDPQDRMKAAVRYGAGGLGGVVDEFGVTVTFQQQAERYARISAAAPTTELQHFDRTDSFLANVQFTSMAGPRHLITYGMDFSLDKITSRREDVSLLTGTRRSGKGVLADNSRYGTWAVFLQDEIDVSPRLHVNLGSRFSEYHPDALVTDPATGSIAIDSHPRALTGSAHALFRVTSALDIVGGVAQGFRAPNIDDLTILGATGGRFEVPNPGLEPETSVNVELGVRGRTLHVSGAANYFVSDINGLIQREPGTYQGRDFGDFNGNGVRDGSEPLILQRRNAGEARIHGAEIEAQWRLADEWSLDGSLVRIIGEELVTGLPLRRIPPTHGRMVLGWKPAGRVWAEAATTFAGDQRRLAPGDLTDVRIPAGGTPGFLTFHTRGGIRISDALQLTVGLDNLTNRSYRTHGSGIEMPGTDVIVGIHWIH